MVKLDSIENRLNKFKGINLTKVPHKEKIILISIFGSYITEEFIEGKSDIDIGIILNKYDLFESLDIEEFIVENISKLVGIKNVHCTILAESSGYRTMKVRTGEIIYSSKTTDELCYDIEELAMKHRMISYYNDILRMEALRL